MAESLKLAREPLRARAGFNADEGWRRPIEERQQGLAPELHPPQELAALIHSDDVEDVLTGIETVNDGITRLGLHSKHPSGHAVSIRAGDGSSVYDDEV
jgi:hypothetical protein